MADRPISFGKQAADRVKSAVQRIEAMPYPHAPAENRYPIISGGMLLAPAVVTTAITAYNSNTNTFGNGAAQIQTQKFNSNTNTYKVANDPNFPSPVKVINWYIHSGTVGISTHITILQRDSNTWMFLTSDCNSG